jgi:acetate kinase
MRILTVNSGSSSVKFDLYFCSGPGDLSKRVSGKVEGLAGLSHVGVTNCISGETVKHEVSVADQEQALTVAMREIAAFLPEVTAESIDRVGFRIVHGGELFSLPVVLTDIAIRGLETLGHPAPLHNPPAIAAIRAAQSLFPSRTMLVGTFDTQFHRELPEVARDYAIPHVLAEKYGIRRYGFHGLAHAYMLDRYCAMTGTKRDRATVITLQLGSGCSSCAIQNGRSVDTSMGFTPLEGLMMRTRSGDIDAGLVSYLAREERMDGHRIEHMLNTESGLAGVSGTDGDMRTLIAGYGSDRRRKLAVDLFCYRIAKYVGSYLPVLGNPQAVIFGGGIGELSPVVRRMVMERFGFMGIRLDESANRFLVGREGHFHAQDSAVGLYVVSVDESVMIASAAASFS